jgi:hypothetical protein
MTCKATVNQRIPALRAEAHVATGSRPEGTHSIFGSVTFLRSSHLHFHACRQVAFVKVHYGVNKQKEYKALTLTRGILIFMVHVGQSKCTGFSPANYK